MLHHIGHRYAMEVIYLTARQYGGDNLMLLCGGKDKYHVCRGLLKRFQERIERAGTEHVHLIDNEHTVAS